MNRFVCVLALACFVVSTNASCSSCSGVVDSGYLGERLRGEIIRGDGVVGGYPTLGGAEVINGACGGVEVLQNGPILNGADIFGQGPYLNEGVLNGAEIIGNGRILNRGVDILNGAEIIGNRGGVEILNGAEIIGNRGILNGGCGIVNGAEIIGNRGILNGGCGIVNGAEIIGNQGILNGGVGIVNGAEIIGNGGILNGGVEVINGPYNRAEIIEGSYPGVASGVIGSEVLVGGGVPSIVSRGLSRSCGPAPTLNPIRTLSPLVLQPVNGPIQVLPSARPPPPQVISNKCSCTKIVEKPQLYQRIIQVQKNQRFLKKTYTPVEEKMAYCARPRC